MLNPWHICGPHCYWCNGGLCHADPVTEKATEGTRGCRFWICSVCGRGWVEVDEGAWIDHTPCFKATRGKGKVVQCVRVKNL